MKRETLSDIEKRMMRLCNRAARFRRFSSERHSVPGLNVEDELKLVSNKARFLSGVASGDIKCINRKRGELLQEIIERGFDPIPVEWLPVETGYAADYESEGDEECPAKDTTGYEYLTSIPCGSLGDDTLHELLKRKSELEEIMRSATPLHPGLTRLKISEKEPNVLDVNYNEAQSDGVLWMDISAKDSNVPMRRHKRAAADSVEASAMLIDNEDEGPELEDRPTQRQSIQIQRRKKHRTKPRKNMCCAERWSVEYIMIKCTQDIESCMQLFS